MSELDVLEVTADGREILARRPLSPADTYLEVVLARWRGQYVTWIFNKTLGKNGGFVVGHYFGNDYDAALNDFSTRR